jgi:hypothetical protein
MMFYIKSFIIFLLPVSIPKSPRKISHHLFHQEVAKSNVTLRRSGKVLVLGADKVSSRG